MTAFVHTTWISAADWFAVLRIGTGLWWLESYRHKDKKAWLVDGAGIAWAASVAGKHRWPAVGRLFGAVVAPRARVVAYAVVFGELAVGIGLVAGFLTPVAAFAGIALNLVYLVLMISDWAEQGQNLMMILATAVVLGAHGWSVWSLDHLTGLF